MSIVAEFSVVPIGKGTSLGRFVKQAVSEMRRRFPRLKVEHHAMGSNLEAENISEVYAAVRVAHEALFRLGARRVVTSLKVDDRRDKRHSISSKEKIFRRASPQGRRNPRRR